MKTKLAKKNKFLKKLNFSCYMLKKRFCIKLSTKLLYKISLGIRKYLYN